MAQLRQVPREIHKHIRARSYIGGSALGVSDGLVTNLAFLSGFAAIESGKISLIQVAGLASMLAGAISMFFSEILLRCEGLDSGRSGEDRRTNSLKQGKVPRGHSDARTSCPPSETVESDQDGRSYWTIVSSRRTNPSSSFSASHNSNARIARFRSNIGSVLVSSGSLEGARRRKETMEERTGNVSHRCSSRINPIPNRWIPLIFLGLKKCSLVVFSGRFPGETVSPPLVPESFPVHPCTS